MQKVVNAHRIVFFILLLAISNSIFSQKILEGRFADNADWYDFHSNGIFDYANTEGLGIGRYGKGHYTLTKDGLILDYDLTEIPFSGYHITKSYVNSKDSIDIDICVYDLDKNPLPNSQVFLTKGIGKDHLLTDKNGKIRLTIKKEKVEDFLTIIYNYECMHHIPEIFFHWNYEIDVYLTKKPFTEPFDRGKAMKNEIQKYKIIRQKKDYLEIKKSNGNKLKYERTKEGYYANDPFE